MDNLENFKNDPERIEILNRILDAYDNAVVSHRLDENQNVIAVYDKYSNIQINKLIRELREYEHQKYDVRGGVYPFPMVMNGKLYEPEVKVEKTFFIETNDVEYLEKQLKKAIENEDFEACEKLQMKINKLRKK